MTVPNINQIVRNAWEASRKANAMEATVPKPTNFAMRLAHTEAVTAHTSASGALTTGGRAGEAAAHTKAIADHNLKLKSY